MRRCIALMTWGLLVSQAPLASAHHDGASAPGGMTSSVSVLPAVGATVVPRSQASFVVRYRRLSDRPPSYLVPLDDPGDHFGVAEAGLTHAFSPRVAMSLAMPVVLRVPGAKDEGDPRVGAGDLRLGTRVVPWIEGAGRASVSVGLDLSFPSGGRRGDDALRLGAGDVLGRASVLGLVQIAEAWRITAEVGAETAPRPGANVVLDYALSGSWSPWSWGSAFLDVRARSYLRSEALGLSLPANLPREAGDTAVVLTPGLSVAPAEGVRISGGPEIPVSSVKDYALGATVGAVIAF